MWIAAAPSDAMAAARAASLRSVPASALKFTGPMLPTGWEANQHWPITVRCQIGAPTPDQSGAGTSKSENNRQTWTTPPLDASPRRRRASKSSFRG